MAGAAARGGDGNERGVGNKTGLLNWSRPAGEQPVAHRAVQEVSGGARGAERRPGGPRGTSVLTGDCHREAPAAATVTGAGAGASGNDGAVAATAGARTLAQAILRSQQGALVTDWPGSCPGSQQASSAPPSAGAAGSAICPVRRHTSSGVLETLQAPAPINQARTTASQRGLIRVDCSPILSAIAGPPPSRAAGAGRSAVR